MYRVSETSCCKIKTSDQEKPSDSSILFRVLLLYRNKYVRNNDRIISRQFSLTNEHKS